MSEEYTLTTNDQKLTESSIHFLASNSQEMLKLCGNGDIYVRGRLVENDKEVVDAMRQFLKLQNFLK